MFSSFAEIFLVREELPAALLFVSSFMDFLAYRFLNFDLNWLGLEKQIFYIF